MRLTAILDDETIHSLEMPLSDAEQSAASGIRTILLPLGPYRNLTTLLASVMALHPEVMVLNHAATRVLCIQGADFLHDCRLSVQQKFIEIAVRLAQAGRRGDFGGSILRSHAFDDPELRQFYQRRYGDRILKPHCHALLWKDSQRLQNHLSEKDDALPRLLETFDNIKFILPVRNPIHCARSNLATGHWQHLGENVGGEFATVLRYILRNIRWAWTSPIFARDRLLVVWEDELTSSALPALCRLAGIETDEVWLDQISRVKINARPTTVDDVRLYERIVTQEIGDLPNLRERLLRFALPTP